MECGWGDKVSRKIIAQVSLDGWALVWVSFSTRAVRAELAMPTADTAVAPALEPVQDQQ